MISDDLGKMLHDRSTRGEVLSDEEQAQLASWYAYQDELESHILAAVPQAKTLAQLQSQIEVGDIKPNPNHKRYLDILRKMTPTQRLMKAFELSEFSKQLFIHGLRRRFPELPPEEFTELLHQRLEKCHNRNY